MIKTRLLVCNGIKTTNRIIYFAGEGNEHSIDAEVQKKQTEITDKVSKLERDIQSGSIDVSTAVDNTKKEIRDISKPVLTNIDNLQAKIEKLGSSGDIGTQLSKLDDLKTNLKKTILSATEKLNTFKGEYQKQHGNIIKDTTTQVINVQPVVIVADPKYAELGRAQAEADKVFNAPAATANVPKNTPTLPSINPQKADTTGQIDQAKIAQNSNSKIPTHKDNESPDNRVASR